MLKFGKLLLLLFPLFSMLSFSFADSGEGGGDDDDDDSGGAPDGALQALIGKHNNDLMSVVNTLFVDNYKARDKNRKLRAQITELSGKVPGDDSLILPAEEAATYQAFLKLDLAPDTIKEKLQNFEQVSQELDRAKKETTLRQAADLHGLKFSVLDRLVGQDFAVEVREVEADGKTSKVAYIQNGDGQGAKPLLEYADQQWKDFLPALRVETETQAGGTQYVSQSAGVTPPAGNVVDAFIKKTNEDRAKRPNPLAKE